MPAVRALVWLLWLLLLPLAATAQPSWQELPNTRLTDVCPPNHPVYPFRTKCYNVVQSFSGAALDTTRSRLLVWGGGHAAYAGNEVYALNLLTPAWERLTDPSTDPAILTCVDRVPDGRPTSRHTYNMLAYLPTLDRLWAFGGSKFCGSGAAGTDTWTFDLTTLAWQYMQPPGPRPGQAILATIWDPETARIYAREKSHFYSYDPAANVWQRLKAWDSPLDMSHKTAVLDPVRRQMVLVGGSPAGNVYVIDLAPGSNYTARAVPTTGGQAIVGARAPGVDYDPVQARIVAWDGGTDAVDATAVYTLDLSTGIWTTTTAPGGPPKSTATGIYGRWRYVPALTAFIAVNSAQRNAWLFRFAPAAEPPPNPEPPVDPPPVEPPPIVVPPPEPPPEPPPVVEVPPDEPPPDEPLPPPATNAPPAFFLIVSKLGGQPTNYNDTIPVVSGVTQVQLQTINTSFAPVKKLGWRVQLLLDEQPLGEPFVTTTIPLTVPWDTRTVPDGTHLLGMQVLDAPADVTPSALPAMVIVDNVPGPVTGPQRLPVCGSKIQSGFDVGLTPFRCDWVLYGGQPPVLSGHPYPGVRGVPFATVPTPAEVWVEHIVPRLTLYLTHRGFFQTADGHVVVGNWNTQSGETWQNVANHVDRSPFGDGPRNTVALSAYTNGVVHPDTEALVFVETGGRGRVGTIDLTGAITTIAGARTRAGVLPYLPSDLSIPRSIRDVQYEQVGTFLDGPVGFDTPMDIAMDPRNAAILYVADSQHHRIARVDTSVSPAVVTTYAGSLTGESGLRNGLGTDALFHTPFSVAMNADGTLYVADRGNSLIRQVSPERAVTTLVGQGYTPGVTEASLDVLSAAKNRDNHMRNGPFGTASIIYPMAIRLDSQGNLILAENLLGTIRRINVQAQTVELLRISIAGRRKWVWLDVDREGTFGPKDDIFYLTGTGPRNEFLWRFPIDGSAPKPVFTGSYHLEGRGTIARSPHYPWMVVVGKGALWANGFGSGGMFRVRKARVGERVDSPKQLSDAYQAGEHVWRFGTATGFPWDARPPLSMPRGRFGLNFFGLPNFDDIAHLSEAELAAQIQAGFGGSVPRPEITGKDLRYLLYFIRRNAVPTIHSAASLLGPAPTDTTAPQIEAVQVTPLSTTEARVAWRTSEPALGFVWLGPAPGQYPRWSALESGYTTDHAVVLRDLTPGATYHYRVVAKDEAGNRAETTDAIFVAAKPDEPPPPPLPTPQVVVISPAVGQVVIGREVQVRYTVTDLPADGAVTLQLGTLPAVPDADTDGMYTFEQVRPGAHTLRVTLRQADGARYPNPEAEAVLSVSTQLSSADLGFLLPAVQAGAWSDPATWGGTLPTPHDAVHIAGGLTVTYDMPYNADAAAEARTITIEDGGVLTFSRDASTRLDLDGSLLVLSGGTLEVGTPAAPIPLGVRVWIGFNVANDRFFSGSGNPGPEPEMFDFHPEDVGLWVAGHDAPATLVMHGTPKARVWTKLAEDAVAGSTTITVRDALDGWQPGDRILLTPTGRDPDQAEERVITTMPSQHTVMLDTPLSYTHYGRSYTVNGVTVALQGEVALLSHNITVASNLVTAASPHHRAHTMHMLRARGTLAYVEFRDLGPRAIVGRYPLHFHKLSTADHGLTVEGVSIWSSVPDPTNKWVAIHASEGVTVRGSVGYNAQGRGFYLEDAKERGNVLEGNLGVWVHTPEELPNHRIPALAQLEPLNGAAVFWVRQGNTLRGNVAAGGRADVAGFVVTPNLLDVATHQNACVGNEAHSTGTGALFTGPASLACQDLLLWHTRAAVGVALGAQPHLTGVVLVGNADQVLDVAGYAAHVPGVTLEGETYTVGLDGGLSWP